MRFAQYFYAEANLPNIHGLALFQADGLIGLYRPESVRNMLLRRTEFSDEGVVAALQTRYNARYDCQETEGVAAEHGFGPIIYLIGMQLSPNGLCPNRVRTQMNPEATRVWREFYDGKGSHMAEKEPLVSVDGELATHHEDAFLNMKYFSNQPIDLSQARRLNEVILKNDPYDEKRIGLWEVIDAYLSNALVAAGY